MTIVDTIKERYNGLDPANRRILAILTGIALILATVYGLILGHLNSMEIKKAAREKSLAELLVLQQRHREAAIGAQRLTNRLAAVTAEDNPVLLLEQSGIVPRGGIQAKPLPRRETNGILEESSEITISGLSANELVNLLHRLEQHPKPVALRSFTAKTRFNDPAKLDAIIALALLRPAPSGAAPK